MPSTTADASAPPAPCTKRAAISAPCEGATAHNMEAAVKTARPIRKMRRWPRRSPKRPASSSRPPNGIRYAFTTHARLELEKSRSVWMDGRATFTIVASRTIIRTPAHNT